MKLRYFGPSLLAVGYVQKSKVVHVLVSRLEITAVECTCGDCVVL